MKQKTMRLSLALIKTRECSRSLLTTACAALLLSSCTARIHEIPIEKGPGVPVQITVASIEQEPFAPFGTKAAATLSDVCSVISYGIYSADGNTVVKSQTSQKSTDESFGVINLRLEEGEYKMIILAHSCDKNPSLKDLSKFEFTTSTIRRITDTFLHSENFIVSKGMSSINVNLERVTAKFELRLQEKYIPQEVSAIEFQFGPECYFNLNANTGYAVKSSGTTKLTDKISVTPGDSIVEAYAFVCPDVTNTNVSIKAIDTDGNEYISITAANVPITRNRKTIYRVNMFAHEIVNTDGSIVIDNDWGGTDVIVAPE